MTKQIARMVDANNNFIPVWGGIDEKRAKDAAYFYFLNPCSDNYKAAQKAIIKARKVNLDKELINELKEG